MRRIVVGTVKGLFEVEAGASGARADGGPLADREVTALSGDAGVLWALADGRSVLRSDRDGAWEEVADAGPFELTCLLPTSAGLLVGAGHARLLRLESGSLEPVASFDEVTGRETWYTPWGGPPAVRSLAQDRAGRLHVNVHVGGIPCSADGGRTWHPTIDVDADVHQVLAHPSTEGLVLAATAMGLAVSEDGGGRWHFERGGMHAHYCRAVAVSAGTVLVTASTGPWGGHAAVYRAPLDAVSQLERCAAGLPEWFDANVDSGCLAADGATVAFGTADGSLFESEDSGATWAEIAAGLPQVRAVALV